MPRGLQNLRPEKWEENWNKIKDMAEKSIFLVKKRHEWWNEECDEAFRCKGEAWKDQAQPKGIVAY